MLAFDHLVFLKNKPEEAITPLKDSGIHAVNGGRHQNWGTYNSLTYFGLSYIEFLGVENQAVAEQQRENRLVVETVDKLLREGMEGPAKIAIRTDRIQELAEQLEHAGFTVYGPLPGERTRADGQVIKWSLLFPESNQTELSLPFFIQWEKSDEERLAEFKEQGLVGAQTTGSPQFAHVGFAVRDLEETVGLWEKLLNLPISEEFVDDELQARCKTIKLPGTELVFCSPLGEGMVQTVIQERGECPFLVTLRDTKRERLLELFAGYWKFTI
ncbi:VOC family protein [Bacillus rubiinfantis]|uniref:VOC family protein n=1 Tax=Bacillus rubiinfantis TaxID=1499680 RepID=UPI0005AA2945|nr:VOC family protein [Bacillus rubiinfantis]